MFKHFGMQIKQYFILQSKYKMCNKHENSLCEPHHTGDKTNER